MALESVTPFDPCLIEPQSRPPRARASARVLAGRIGRLLGREPLAVVAAQVTGATGPPDVAGTIRGLLGVGFPLALRPRDRVPCDGPLLVLVFRESGAGAPMARAPSTLDVARIARASGAGVLPVVVREHPRRALLGTPIPADRVARIAGDAALGGFLQSRAVALLHRPLAASLAPAPGGAAVVVDAEAPDLVAAEIEGLRDDQRLVESGRFLVVHARAHEIPACVRELGRLREITFRAAGEGTGRALDLDAYDRIYRHLVLFDREACRVAGAYRFAQTDEVLPVFGVRGLYTSTLFRLAPELFEELGPALELGRSFVRSEYQRAYAPLLLLWRGLCAFVARNPRYRTLFGAVSVPASYEAFSRALLAQTLSEPGQRHPLARYVAPRHPLRMRRSLRRALGRLPQTLEDACELSAVVADAEADGKGLPILLREYLKLGGRVLGFSVDPAFAGVLDGLVAVDLVSSDRRRLDAYMGREAAQEFLGHYAREACLSAPLC